MVVHSTHTSCANPICKYPNIFLLRSIQLSAPSTITHAQCLIPPHMHVHCSLFRPMGYTFAHTSLAFLANLPHFPPHNSIYRQHYQSQLVPVAYCSIYHPKSTLTVQYSHILCHISMQYTVLEPKESEHLCWPKAIVSFVMTGEKQILLGSK